jgi:hypothetical protein
MTTKRLAEIEKLLSGIIPFKTLGIPNNNSRSGLVGRTRIHLCEHTHTCLKKGDQCYVQVVCGEMLTVYTSCKVEIEKNRIIFSNRGQRTVVWTGERK